jgi:4-amino-4-deoxy-L-arabinose transferase-like glycosyltransferase
MMLPLTRKRLMWALVAIGLLRLVVMATMPLADNTESRYAEMSAMMLYTHDWITPYFDTNVPFWGKPPMLFWLGAGLAKVLGLHEFSLRLPSWLASVAMAALVYQAGKQLYNKDAALLGTLCFASTVVVFIASGAVMTDAIFALGTTLATLGIAVNIQQKHRLWGYAAFIGLALGLLAKGPLILLLMGVTLVGWLTITRDFSPLKRLPWASGTGLTLLLSVPWYIVAELKTPGFLNYFIVGEHFQRFIQPGWQGDLYGSGHKQPHGSIWIHFLWCAFPVTFIPLTFLYKAFTTKAWHRLTPMDSSLRVFLLMAALTSAMVFTLSGNILWTYVLPGIAPLALMLGPSLALRFKEAQALRWATFFLMVPVVCTLVMGYLSFDFKQLRTEKFLIHALHQHSGEANTPVVYVDLIPYSAKFYSHQQATLLTSDEFKALPTGTHPYVAIKNTTLANDATLAQSAKVVYTGRHYTLLAFQLGLH